MRGRLLIAVSRGPDVVVYPAKKHTDFQSGLDDVFQKSLGKRAVLAITIFRDLAVSSRISDKRACFWLDPGEAASNRTRRHGFLHPRQEWIVAAGIQDHDAEFFDFSGGLQKVI